MRTVFAYALLLCALGGPVHAESRVLDKLDYTVAASLPPELATKLIRDGL